MRVFIDSQETGLLSPMYAGREIVVAIDPSKSNTGITVGNTSCRVLDYFEFNGKEDGTTEYDALALCKKQREAMSIIFNGSIPKIVGIEDIITKVTKDKNGQEKKTGMTEHSSRFKITAVFMSFICYFQDTFGIMPLLINNQAWKAAVLPEKYRTRAYDKGSLAYFRDTGSKYGACSDDVTDSLCIFKYLCMIAGLKPVISIEAAEGARHTCDIAFVQKDMQLKHPEVAFKYNKVLGVNACATVMANNIQPLQAATAIIPVDDLEFGDLYKYCVGQFKECTPDIKMVVLRRE